MLKYLHSFETWLFGLVLLLFIFIPLYPKLPLFNVNGTFVAIRLEDILIALISILTAVYIYRQKNVRQYLDDNLYLALLVFALIGIVSLFSAVFLTQTIIPHLGILHFLRRIELMILVPVVYTAVKSRKQVSIILISLLITTFLADVYAFGQKYLDWPVISTGNSEFAKGLILHLTPGARVSSTFAGHYDLAIYLTMFLGIATALFFAIKNFKVNIFLILTSVLSFVVLIMTAARLSFVAAIIGIAASFVLVGRWIFIFIIFFMVIAVIAYPTQLRDRFISTVLINLQGGGERFVATGDYQLERSKLNIPTLPGKPASFSAGSSTTSAVANDITPGEPIDMTELEVYRSFGIRLNQEWPAAVRAFYKNPFLGTGYSSLGLATDNDFLRSLGEVGFMGTFAFVLVIWEITKRVWKNYKRGDKYLKFFSAGILSMILVFFVNGLFIDAFEASKVASLFWMLIGLNLAAGEHK